MSNDFLREAFDGNQLINLLERTVRPVYMDNYQKSLVWQYYRSGLPVRDKLSTHESVVSPICPRCGEGRETVKYIFVVCLELSRLLSAREGKQLSAESLIKIVPLPSLNRENKNLFLFSV